MSHASQAFETHGTVRLGGNEPHISDRWDLNPQHSAWRADALPIELLPHTNIAELESATSHSVSAGALPAELYVLAVLLVIR